MFFYPSFQYCNLKERVSSVLERFSFLRETIFTRIFLSIYAYNDTKNGSSLNVLRTCHRRTQSSLDLAEMNGTDKTTLTLKYAFLYVRMGLAQSRVLYVPYMVILEPESVTDYRTIRMEQAEVNGSGVHLYKNGLHVSLNYSCKCCRLTQTAPINMPSWP